MLRKENKGAPIVRNNRGRDRFNQAFEGAPTDQFLAVATIFVEDVLGLTEATAVKRWACSKAYRGRQKLTVLEVIGEISAVEHFRNFEGWHFGLLALAPWGRGLRRSTHGWLLRPRPQPLSLR